MIKILKFFILSMLCLTLKAQQDPEAQKILEAFSNKYKKYTSIKMNFTFAIENHQTGENTKSKAEMWLKGNKYKIILNNHHTYFDGKDIYNYMPNEKEVSIAKPNPKKDESFLQNPSQIFTIYKKDFKFRLLGQTQWNKKSCYEVDLYPIDINKNYSIIKLLIDNDNYDLIAAKMIMKNGIHYIIYVEKITTNEKINDNEFTFDIKAHKGVEVIDLRK